MKLTKNVGRIDHVVITVFPQNFDACIAKFSSALGVAFSETLRREDLNVMASVAWEAGIEVLAPIKEEGVFYDRLKQRGEGHMTVVFGVEDFDSACRQAMEAGVKPGREVGLMGDEPWFDQFKVMRESRLEPIFGATVILGQIEPKE